MSGGNYSCFDVPVDLSLTGSQVSPTHKSRHGSSRSSVSSKMNSSFKNSPRHSRSKSSTQVSKQKSTHSTKKISAPKEKATSLAVTFPSKENKKSKQANVSMTSNEDFLDSFFKQPRSNSNTPSRSSSSYSKKKSKYVEERVFDIPDTARSESVCSDRVLSTGSSLLNFGEYNGNKTDYFGSGDANDVDYLKSYLGNMDKYRSPESLVKNNDFDATPRASLSASSLPRSSQSTPRVISSDLGDMKKDPLQEEDVLHFRRNRSARNIQTWYRRHAARKKRNEAVMKRMLAEKKEELVKNSLRDSLKLTHRTEEEKRKHREQREKDARKQAIRELQEKRKAEKEKMRRIAEEEVEAVKKRVEAEKRKSRARVSSKSSRVSTADRDEAVAVAHAQEDHDVIEDQSTTAKSDNRDSPSEAAGSIPGGDVVRSRTTLDDVLETIKLLEEEPQGLKKPKSALDEKLSWIDDLQVELRSNLSKTSASTHRSHQTSTDPSLLLTEAKLQSINSFLDEVEKKNPPPVPQMDEMKSDQQLAEAEQAASEVTSQVLKLKLNLEEKSRSVKLLQDALTQQRDLNLRQIKEQEAEFNHRYKMQKDQYESAIQRHLSFIDQLIDDKKTLNEKCEKLVAEMKQAEGKYQKKIKSLTDSHQAELQKSKDVLAATEKMRREKWIDEKTKKIKEMTVKGLEPEIQRLIAKHKEEMKKVKSIHEAELLRSDERAGQRYIRQTEELREQLEREKEAACTREREVARQRYEKQLEQEEIALQQQRKRLYTEVAEEKERSNQQLLRQRRELDELKQQIEANGRIASSALRDEFEKSTEDLQKRHKEDMKSLHERLQIEKQAWQENYMKKQEAFMIQKERELKEAVRRDRDSEIETAILRLEDDMHQQREELDKTTENRIKRIRDKYEAEMKEVERSEKQTQEKYNSMKEEFNEIESENIRLQSQCKQKEQEVSDMLKIKNKLVEERGNVSEVIRQEFADRLVITDEENKRMKNELSELRARQRLELERINNEKEDELAEVHKRVRQAIIKKEETIAQIRQQYESAVKRSEHLESLLEQQRKKVLGKKK